MEQKLANCLKAFKIFVLVEVIIILIMMIPLRYKTLWLIKENNKIEWNWENTKYKQPQLVQVFPDSNATKNDIQITTIVNLKDPNDNHSFSGLPLIIDIINGILEIWIIIVIFKYLKFVYKLSISHLFLIETPIKLREFTIKLGIINILFQLFMTYDNYNIAFNTKLPNYRTGLFSYDQFDTSVIPITIILLFLSYIWQYAISIKSENDLTV